MLEMGPERNSFMGRETLMVSIPYAGYSLGIKAFLTYDVFSIDIIMKKEKWEKKLLISKTIRELDTL